MDTRTLSLIQVNINVYSFNKIVVVGHAGYNMDKTIASNVDGLDIVVGEHTDTFLYTGKKTCIPLTRL